jgi:two-component system chemotaxis response regulator CheY
MKILVLDDSKTMLRIISNTLKRIGETNIVTAEDGVIGLEKWEEHDGDFSLILTDWNMPNMTGLEFVKEIRKQNTEIPIVMITTEGERKSVIIALKAGVNNFIIKPFTPAVLKGKLADILGEND